MENEKIRILKMVEDGKLTAEEAMKLIESMGKTDLVKVPDHSKRGSGPRFLKIRVYEDGTKKPKVNIAIPLGLAKIVTKFLPGSAKMELNNRKIDLEDLISTITDATEGKILEIHDEEDNEHVEIVIE